MPKDRGDEKVGKEELVRIKPELLDEVLRGYRGPQDFEEIFKRFKKAIMERALGAELTRHLGYGKGEDKPEDQTNHRNGVSGKRLLTDQGELEIEVPGDRDGSFEPQLIKKGERRFTGFDDKIIAMYARGMTVREIQGYLEEMYGILVSPDLISQVTDAVIRPTPSRACTCSLEKSSRPGPFPQRRCRGEATLSGVEKHYQRLEDECAGVEVCHESIRNSFR
jgi:putative transposase